MGNQQFCGAQCSQPTKLKESTVSLQRSAVIELVDNLPRIKGKFNFTKQASFTKIERAASEYCQNNEINGMHVPIVARLIAYQQTHYFDAINQLSMQNRETFLLNQEQIDIELMDSLYHYFVVKEKEQKSTQLFLGEGKVTEPPLIDIEQLKKEHLNELADEGIHLLKMGKVGLIIMMAGHAENSEPTSKAFGRMKLPDNPTVLELLLRRYSGYLNGQDSTQSILKIKKRKAPVIIIVGSESTLLKVHKLIQKNNYFGLIPEYVKIIIEDRTVPMISIQGKLCLSAEGKTLGNPAGTALAVNCIMETKHIKDFLIFCQIQYLHFIGCENIAQLPCDPVMVGLTHKFQRQLAGKCVRGGGVYEHYPRYLATQTAFHLLDYKELVALNKPNLTQEAPIALNSLVFRWQSLQLFYRNFETSLYIAKRFHMEERAVNYYDYQKQKPVLWAKVFSFQQDIRDYISASTKAIVVKYWPEHFQPIASPPRQLDKISETFLEPPLY